MSIVNNVVPANRAQQEKKPWTPPTIQILQLNKAQSGGVLNGKDTFQRS